MVFLESHIEKGKESVLGKLMNERNWFEEYKASWKRATFADRETSFFVCSLIVSSIAAPIVFNLINKVMDNYAKKKEKNSA